LEKGELCLSDSNKTKYRHKIKRLPTTLFRKDIVNLQKTI
jgi:hypothetical protein